MPGIRGDPSVVNKRHEGEENPPRLVLRFALFTGVLLALVAGGTFWLVRETATERAERGVESRATLLASQLARELQPSDFGATPSAARRGELDELFRRQVLVGQTLKVKLFNADGLVVYSDDPSLIGHRTDHPEEVEEVLDGRRVREATHVSDSASGRSVRALEAFVPIRFLGAERPSGALEIYEDYAQVAAEIRTTMEKLAAIFVLALLVLYGGMFPILRRVTGSLSAQNRRLETAAQQVASQNQRLLEVDRLKDDFVATVSHELRTPLTSIRGYVDLLLEDDVGELTEQQRAFLETVERSTARLQRLVGDLLFVAQVDASRLRLEREQVDLTALARECVTAASPAAKEKAIALEFSGEPIPDFAADPARLHQLLDNLVSNAIKFTPEGGRVEVLLEAANGLAVLEVRDTGIGFPSADAGRLFERFFRSPNAAEHAIQGTGLGLAIAKAIVEAHEGKIAVASEEGVGTRFRVELPLRPTGEGGREQVSNDASRAPA